ncbi:GTP-binding protein TypA/BipA [hydrothermal vent metagenome]|uniref:GTP-binding protein TypA/BipA n=1 Tax=hydrothermal vent metagenome TaxID=652676 RepID=A0A3B0RJK2_9ZZZZ
MSLRNIAIIAHVDHGKTTLVDTLFRQAGTFRDNERVDERAMDSGDLEKERGITILAKCTSIEWRDHRINIVDTPGHADFGGEVERILSMVDGVILLVDAAEGPMPQTKFVTAKALALGLKPVVVINKVDKPDRRPDAVHDEIFDLFVNLDASDEQLDFPTLFASGRDGWADYELDGPRKNLDPLLETILDYYDKPAVMTKENIDLPFTMLATLLDRDNFLGRVVTGRIQSGKIKVNDQIKVMNPDGNVVETGRASKLMAFRGLDRVPVDHAIAGDIISIAGLSVGTVADTFCVPEVTVPLKAQPIDPPTLSMRFSVNDSPLAGREGTKVTTRMIRDRLALESEGNVAIKITESENKDGFEVAGRGELQLGVLIEMMRREGFELSISRPRVLYKEDPDTGERLEPFEEAVVDVDDEYTGVVVEKMSLRKAEMTDMRPSGTGKTRITFLAPSRGLIGYHGEFMTDTRGTGIMNRVYHSYAPYKGKISGRRVGVLISMGMGKAVAYALWNLEDRGVIMIDPQEEVYEGMIIGEHSRDNDLDVNVLKGKQLTNIRASGKDDAIKLTTPKKLTLEQAIAYINDDELVEVTPKNIRLRKRYLVPHERKKAARTAT